MEFQTERENESDAAAETTKPPEEATDASTGIRED
jgi:hypothetical protein